MPAVRCPTAARWCTVAEVAAVHAHSAGCSQRYEDARGADTAAVGPPSRGGAAAPARKGARRFAEGGIVSRGGLARSIHAAVAKRCHCRRRRLVVALNASPSCHLATLVQLTEGLGLEVRPDAGGGKGRGVFATKVSRSAGLIAHTCWLRACGAAQHAASESMLKHNQHTCLICPAELQSGPAAVQGAASGRHPAQRQPCRWAASEGAGRSTGWRPKRLSIFCGNAVHILPLCLSWLSLCALLSICSCVRSGAGVRPLLPLPGQRGAADGAPD